MKEQIHDLVVEHSVQQRRPDGSTFMSLSLSSAKTLKQMTNLSLYKVEKVALEKGITPTRFCRNQQVLSIEDQLKLHRAHVAVVGLGGLGGGVTELLARAGIGNLTLIDGDVFDETNLNRQLLSSTRNIGSAKATVAQKRVQEINPAARITSHQLFLNDNNGPDLLEKAELAIDCLDTISGRFSLGRACRERKIILVSAAIAGKCGQATTFSPDGPGLSALYGEEDKAPEKGVEASLGTLGYAAAHMSAIECAEAINIILGLDSPLQPGLLFSDLSDYSLEKIQTG